MVVSIFKHVYDWGRTCIRLGANLYTIGGELVGGELVMGRNRPLPMATAFGSGLHAAYKVNCLFKRDANKSISGVHLKLFKAFISVGV